MTAEATTERQRTDAFLAAFLQSADLALRPPRPPGDHTALAARAIYHGLEGLLAEDLRFAEVAPEAHEALFRRAAGQALHEALHAAALREVFGAFADAGIDGLLLKGSAVAYLVYGKPTHRPRLDSDILVRGAQRAEAERALERLGFTAPPLHAPHSQRAFSLSRGGGEIAIDLHWGAANSAVISRQFDFEALAMARQAVAALHPDAYAPGLAECLGFALMHLRFERQHPEGDRLIWLLDLARIGGRMDAAEWQRFATWIEDIGMAGAARETLHAAETALGAFVPPEVMARLEAAPAGDLSAFLAASDLARMRREILCRPPSEAAWFLRETLLPPPERLEEKYGKVSRWKLPLLYLRRAVGGIAQRGGR